MQWDKTTADPTQSLYHLGVVTDTKQMRYFTPRQKLDILSARISNILERANSGQSVPCRELAKVLGSVAALRRSHGPVTIVMSRAAQHMLGVTVVAQGWDADLYLNCHVCEELRFLWSELYHFNGQHIFSMSSFSHVYELAAVAEKIRRIRDTAEDLPELYVSDASASHAFVYKADGTFKFVQDFAFTSDQSGLSSGHRELLAVKSALLADAAQFTRLAPVKIFWQTD